MLASSNQTVDIIIATYNAKGLISEQLESILNQTHNNIRVLIRDDGSTDDTISIIKKFCEKDKRVFLIEDDLPANGVGENFKILLSHCSSEYVFLSDQDDVWVNDKIEKLLQFAIGKFSLNEPSIAYAPGFVTDQNLVKTALLTNYRNKAVCIQDILLTNGGIQGCAMVINKALYLKARECDFYWYMHDQVLTALAVSFGKTYFLPEPLFFYRQHSFNVLGFNQSTYISKIKKYLKKSGVTFCVNKKSKDFFSFFYKKYDFSLEATENSMLKDFLTLDNKDKCSQYSFILKYNVKHQHSLFKSLSKCFISKSFFEE